MGTSTTGQKGEARAGIAYPRPYHKTELLTWLLQRLGYQVAYL